MPKKAFKLERFDGGLNNNNLPRDIEPIEVSDVSNYIFDELGQIRTMGNFENHDAGAGEISDFTMKAGHNVYAYSTDFDKLGNDDGEDWIVFADSNISNGMYIYARSTDNQAFSGVLTLAGTSNAQIVFHNLDGTLYVTDGNFSNNCINEAREYIKSTQFPGTTETRVIDAWTDYQTTLFAPSQDAKWAYNANPTVATGSTAHPLIRINSSGTGGWSLDTNNFDLFYSYVYRDGSETQLENFTKVTSGLPISNKELTFKVWITNPSNHASISSNIGAQYKGIRIYWKGALSVYENSHQLLFDIDFEKGWKIGNSTYYEQDWGDFEDNTTISSTTQDWYFAVYDTITNPSDIAALTYESINGLPQDELITSVRYKTSVVANRRVYVGNVRYSEGGSTKTFNDRILKSSVNEPLSFSHKGIIDVTVNDGDEITALSEYADRLLEFKKKKMHIINISKQYEFLEDTFIGKGCAGQFAVAKTDSGVAWVNENGCFFYNGRNIENLFENRRSTIINLNLWQSDYTESALLGYAPKARKLIIYPDASGSSDDIYIYNFPTRSWTKGVASTTDAKSNFIVDYNEDLCVLDSVSPALTLDDTFKKWNDSSQTHSTSTLITKDIDFGNPSTKKHIKKIYVSYKSVSGNRPVLTYGLNGSNTITSTFTTIPPNQSDFTAVEYVPSSSIRNAYSIRLKFDGAVDSSFIISDISIIYREKSPR